MVRIHKYYDELYTNTNPYIFKSFNQTSNVKTEQVEDDKFQKEVNNAENNIKDPSVEAKKMVEEAQKQADKIIQNAKWEADIMMKKAISDGYQNGLTLVNDKIDKLISEANQSTQSIIEDTKLKTSEIFDELEQNSLDISINIAKKILDVELDRNDTAITSVIKQAINKIKDDTEAKLILNTEDLRNIEDTEAFKMLKEQTNGRLQFVTENNINKGDVLIKTDGQIIDAGITTQFLNIKNALLQNT